MRLRSKFLPAATATAAAFALTVAGGVTPATAHDEGGAHRQSQDVPSDLIADIRAATAEFHNPAKAEAAGFVPDEHCEPGMGQHWVNPQNIEDGVHDPKNPDVLLYEVRPNGKPRLVGVEWLQWDADQDLSTDEDRPELRGMAFDGPMAGHGPGMPIHYDLHVWTHDDNPAGAWTPVNTSPDLACP